MKHSIDYYIEHIEPMIDNLNRQQEIQIDNTKFLVLKVRTKGVTYILIASQYNWNGVHYWVYNTNTKQVENIIHSTYHFMFRFKLGVPHIRFITYIRKTTKKKQYEYRIRNNR